MLLARVHPLPEGSSSEGPGRPGASGLGWKDVPLCQTPESLFPRGRPGRGVRVWGKGSREATHRLGLLFPGVGAWGRLAPHHPAQCRPILTTGSRWGLAPLRAQGWPGEQCQAAGAAPGSRAAEGPRGSEPTTNQDSQLALREQVPGKAAGVGVQGEHVRE